MSDSADHLVLRQTGVAADGGVIVDLSVGGLLQQFGNAQAGVHNIAVQGCDGADQFEFIDVSAPIVLDGGAGDDVLHGQASDTDWQVDGANAGRLGAVVFSGIETLVGASDNHDTFVLLDGGVLDGGVDGGAGGYDTLKIALSGAPDLAYSASGPYSGVVLAGGVSTAFEGLEPVTVGTDGAGNVSVTLTADR